VQRMILLAATAVLLAGSATAASAAPRMPIGFYDDFSFRWSPDVAKNLHAAQQAGASVIHVTADWSQIAAKQPAVPANGDDPAYVIADLDALVQNAPRYGLQVMINISGAPKWANGGQSPNHPPTNLSTLTTFAHMLARRYNGYSHHGLVGRWSVWNEPNLELFLTPQFSGSKIVSPATYAKIYLAAYSGIKSGNPSALVAIGETSNRGRNQPIPDQSGTVAPATFAHLLSTVAPHLPFDAYATHPYPTDPFLSPTQQVAYPNVTMTRITQFGASLQQWFHRRVPIWITEFALQTKPEFPAGVTYAQQAAYAKQALQMAAASPYVEMFIWFTIRDSPSTWQSGLFRSNGATKPSYAAFASVAKTIVGQTQQVAPGRTPKVKVYVPFMAYHDAIGTRLASILRLYDGKKLVDVQQENLVLAVDQSVSLSLNFKPVRGKQYTLIADVNDIHAQHDKRTVLLQTT
jgi:polysaccharide biosynthesis protein PslG